MSDHDVRAGIQQAKVGDTGLMILAIEALIIAVIVGAYAQSWAIGIFSFMGAIIAFFAMAKSETLGNALAVVVGVAWGAAAFFIATSMDASAGAAWASAILVGLVGIGGHAAGFQHIRDIQRAKG
jgi:hypothetical protein